jgi:SAM-dependent methyltransferase
MTAPTQHFNPYISFWDDLGPPLRPDRQAIEAYGELFQTVHPSAEGAQVMLMGVTPELANATWLAGAKITAIDHSPDMISAIWPGDRHNRHAVTGDWFHLPMPLCSQDVVIGDGVLNFLTYPAEHQALSLSLSSVLRSGGHLVIRAFCAHEKPETPEQILSRAKRREFKNFHDFKLLLLGALQQGNVQAGVEIASAWHLFQEHFPDMNDCAVQTGWPIQTIRTIDLYKDNTKRYFLATPAEIESALSAHFKRCRLLTPTTPWSCPTPLMLFQKRMG